jgi:hypothetical protein
VRIQPSAASGRTIVRAVESGSDYMAQGEYDVVVAAPWPGDYTVTVRFATGTVQTVVRPGAKVQIAANGGISTFTN